MKTVDALNLFITINSLFSGAAEAPSAELFPQFRNYLDMSLAEAWNTEWWPELSQTEERYFRGLYSSLATYGGPTLTSSVEVYDPLTQKYFQSLRAANTANAPTTAGVENSAWWAFCSNTYSGDTWDAGMGVVAVGKKVFYPPTNRYYQAHTAHTASGTFTPDASGSNARWGLLTPFIRYVALDQASQTEIGFVKRVTDKNPLNDDSACDLDWENTSLGITVRNAVPRAFITFRGAAPELTGGVYSSALAYAQGAQVYWDDPATGKGNFYDVLTVTTPGDNPTTAASKFQLAQIPARFKRFLIYSSAAKLLDSDEQEEAATSNRAIAEGYMTIETDAIFRQEGQTPNLNPRTY